MAQHRCRLRAHLRSPAGHVAAGASVRSRWANPESAPAPAPVSSTMCCSGARIDPSMRVNSLRRYSCTQSLRLTLPLVVRGIEPGCTRTRSATLRPCDFDIAAVISRLTAPILCAAASSDSSRFLSSTMATSCSTPPSSGNRYRHAAVSGDLLDRRLDVVGRVVAPVHDQQILDTADDEQLAVGEEAQISGSQPRPFGCAGRRTDKRCAEGAFGLFEVSANSRWRRCRRAPRSHRPFRPDTRYGFRGRRYAPSATAECRN